MFGRVVPLEPLDKTAGLCRLKGFVEGGGGVGAQIMLNQDGLFGLCCKAANMAQVFENAGIIL